MKFGSWIILTSVALLWIVREQHIHPPSAPGSQGSNIFARSEFSLGLVKVTEKAIAERLRM